MVFGNNIVTLSKDNRTILSFNARDALAQVEHNDNNIKVAYAAQWARNSTRSDVKDVVKPYDWTYSTTYKGTGDGFEEAEEPGVDVARLQKQEPILFYDEVILYEDELADNGTTLVSIRLVKKNNKRKTERRVITIMIYTKKKRVGSYKIYSG